MWVCIYRFIVLVASPIAQAITNFDKISLQLDTTAYAGESVHMRTAGPSEVCGTVILYRHCLCSDCDV